MQVFDARQERTVVLPPPGRRALKMRVHLSCPGQTVGWDEVRALIVADTLLRALEAQGAQVFAALAVPDLPPPAMGCLDRILAGYGTHVPEADDDPRADVHIRSAPLPATTSGTSGVQLLVGPVSAQGTGPLPSDAADHDATVRRCALLTAPYREPVVVGAAGLGDAAAALAGWRTLVAAWAHAPSAPVPPAIRDRTGALLDSDLDTPGLLALLDEVADDPGLPDGARFEAFVWLDQFLGLELGRDVGRN